MAAVGLVDVAGHEHVVARSEGDLPSGQEGRLLAGLLGQDEVVGGDDQGDALVLEVGNDGQEGLAVGLVQAVEGLIEEDEAGPASPTPSRASSARRRASAPGRRRMPSWEYMPIWTTSRTVTGKVGSRSLS